MKKVMLMVAAVSSLLLIASIVLYGIYPFSFLCSPAITFGTVAYHFWMRLGVGVVFDVTMNNRADYSKKWYQCRSWEKKLYKKLNVKKWKAKAPTFNPEDFNPKKHSWSEIAQTMCQAELVHETIIVLSFVPIIPSVLWLGELAVFLATSITAALIDAVFVIIQRYNRPRVIRLIKNQ